MATPSHDFLRKLEQRRESIRSTCEEMLMECRAANREMNEGERYRYRQAMADLRDMGEQIAEYHADLERSGIPAHLSRLSLNPQTTSRNAMNHADARDLVYRRGDPRQSWCRDLIRLSMNLDSDGESRAGWPHTPSRSSIIPPSRSTAICPAWTAPVAMPCRPRG
jgi:hypothetical protein